MFGKDLFEIPKAWLDPVCARQLIAAACGTKAMALAPAPWFLFEVFGGCGHLSLASRRAGLPTGPSVDILYQREHRLMADLLTAAGRQLLWVCLIIYMPFWVHLGFPCTFWCRMAHLTRKRSEWANEQTRLRELVFVVLTLQIVQWQASRWQHVSIENPPCCCSWHLDIVQDMLNIASMHVVRFDACGWGLMDPGNQLPYKKAMQIASTTELSCLQRSCKGNHVHQRVEGAVTSGPRRGAWRSQVSGEYPHELCEAWVSRMHAVMKGG